jgi:hypothetical protein
LFGAFPPNYPARLARHTTMAAKADRWFGVENAINFKNPQRDPISIKSDRAMVQTSAQESPIMWS